MKEKNIKKLSTGDASTLKNWLKLSTVAFGENSKSVQFLKNKIKEQGENEEVTADERQFIYVLANL